ncbi:MAG: helix-turn-helix domain-containing protein [Actinobacteria bacterium]|nr:helix-turn-helix domain-containing protein [Actinomycetota bacterium]
MLRTLTAADVVTIADAVADRVKPDPLPQYLDVAQVAERLSVSSSWVYDHAADLRASRLGDGKRATLRFDASAVVAYMESRTIDPPAEPIVAPPLSNLRRRQARRRVGTDREVSQ